MSDELKGPRWMTAAEYVQREGLQFPAAEICRVDPGGDDSTGKIGELTLPFLTMFGAISAFELLDPLPSNPIILIGGNAVGGFSTILPYLTVKGENGLETSGSQRTASAITGPITMSAADGPEANTVVLILENCWSNHSITFDGGAPSQELDLINSVVIDGTVSFNPTNSCEINGSSTNPALSKVFNVNASGGADTFLSLINIKVEGLISSTDGTDAYLYGSTVTNIAASINNLFLTDSFIVGTNSAGTTNTNFGNVLFNPANWDFSSLPISEPTQAGKAWIDTAGGLNIVKVKL